MRAPAAAHGARLPGRAAGHTAAARRQGRPQAPARAGQLRPPRGRPGLCRAGHPWREGARRGAGGAPGAGACVGGQPVLRRPGHELTAGRALLRPRQGTGGFAAGVGQGRLPASDHPKPGSDGHRATSCSWRCDEPAAARRGVADRYRAVRGVRSPAVAGLPRLSVPRRGGHIQRLQLDLRQLWLGRPVPAVAGLQRRGLLPALRPADPGQMDPGRPLEAPADQDLEPAPPALLAGENPGPGQSAGAVHWLARLPAVPPGARRQDRPPRRHLLQDRAGLHRHAHHRRRHGDPEGILVHRLPGRSRHHPDRPGQHRKGSADRRAHRAGHRNHRRRPVAARAHLDPVRIPGRSRRSALARIPRPAHRRGLPLRQSHPLRPAAQATSARCPGPGWTASGHSTTSCWGTPTGSRRPPADRCLVLEATGRPAAGAGQGAVRSCWT